MKQGSTRQGDNRLSRPWLGNHGLDVASVYDGYEAGKTARFRITGYKILVVLVVIDGSKAVLG
jgi:hypothetical protein